MSGIFGLVHLDSSPVLAEELEAMRSAMQHWGPDGGGVWLRESAGLGSLILFNTPEMVNERLPVQSPQGFVLTAAARIDNRPELCAELGIATSACASMADGGLILRAYEKWGENAPEHLIGDWSFAAWHAEERKLFLARDHFGNTGLYYYHDERLFAFASTRQALFALGIPRRLNEFYLACLLVSWQAHHGPQTIELDLHRLPPAHTLTLRGGQVETRLYWRLEDTPELHLKNSDEYVERFLSIYDRAVRDRLRSQKDVGVTLSGGLDSGSVTALAARALREQDKRLKAYTSVPLSDVSHTVSETNFGDELPLAQASASFAGNVDLIKIPAGQMNPLQAIRRALEIHNEPGHAAGNLYWMLDLFATAHRDGLGTLLTGQGGNATVSWTGLEKGQTLGRLFKAGHWLKLLQMVVYPRLPLPLIREARRVLRHGKLDWSRTSINDGFARRIGLASQYIHGSGETSNPEDWHTPLQHRYAIIKPGESFVGCTYSENSAAFALDIRDPTFDKRVMEFTLSIPDREFMSPDGYDRWMIRAAMQGIMPDEVRLNKRRGRQAADLGQRLIDSAAEVETALHEIEGSLLAREHLALMRMREVWQSLKQGVNQRNTRDATTILTRGVMAGLYLAGLEKAS